MAKEMSKAAIRRFSNGHFHNRYFVGDGIDIGAGDDCLSQWTHVFRNIRLVEEWDLKDGDAQHMKKIEDNTYDFVHAAHCLEHLNDPIDGMTNWLRIVKPGGYVIIMVPDFSMYEREIFPSIYNNQHKHGFSLKQSKHPNVFNVLQFCMYFGDIAAVESINLQHAFYNPDDTYDQTKYPTTECAIEFILKKNGTEKEFAQPDIPGITTEKKPKEQKMGGWFPGDN